MKKKKEHKEHEEEIDSTALLCLTDWYNHGTEIYLPAQTGFELLKLLQGQLTWTSEADKSVKRTGNKHKIEETGCNARLLLTDTQNNGAEIYLSPQIGFELLKQLHGELKWITEAKNSAKRSVNRHKIHVVFEDDDEYISYAPYFVYELQMYNGKIDETVVRRFQYCAEMRYETLEAWANELISKAIEPETEEDETPRIDLSQYTEEEKKKIVYDWLAKQSEDHLSYYDDVVAGWVFDLDFFVEMALNGETIPIGHMPYYVCD